MKDLVEIIQTHIPSIANTVTYVVFFVFLILNVSEDFDKIISYVKKILNLQRHVDKIYYLKKRNKYNKELCLPEFIKWQMDLMEKLYDPLIKNKQKEGWNVKFTELDIDGIKQKYEAITLKMKTVEFPFQGVCDKQYLDTKTNINKPKYSENIKQYSRFVRQYYRLVKSTIRYPKRLGYMLEEIKFNNNGDWWVTAHTGIYENNIKSSHILEYEIYKLYKKVQKKKINISELKREELLKKLPMRNAIHQKFIEEGDESNVLVSGKYRESLLSVQVFVLVRNFNGTYDVLRIRRSANVSAKANYLQFIPSGGFEAMNDCDDFDSQWENFSLCKVVFRELLEECFGVDEDDKKMTGNNVSPDKIYQNKHIKKLVAMLSGSIEEKRAHMELLGTTMSLAGLRQEFSFVLRVDDVEFSAELVSNYESSSAIHLVGIDNIENASFWCRNKHPKENVAKDLELLNCTSAGLFELARKSELYREALRRTEEINELRKSRT